MKYYMIIFSKFRLMIDGKDWDNLIVKINFMYN